MSGTAHRRRHGQAGLLVALFVVAGLVFSYGLGHGLPDRVCIENGMSVPAEVAAAMHHASAERGGPEAAGRAPTGQAPDVHTAPVHGVPGHPGPSVTSLSAPLRLPPLAPADACLCLAVLFAWVWGADVGGLFTALGVSSIVIGLALQNAVGPIVSGLFLLFEQPFRLGDWLDTGSVRGRVIEVNWRAVHIDTGNGIQIVPNGSLADASFTNLSKAPGPFLLSSTLTFRLPPFCMASSALVNRLLNTCPSSMRWLITSGCWASSKTTLTLA